MTALLAVAACGNGWKPVEGRIMTRWADEVDPQNTLGEYPRPSMVRDGQWTSLNGLWDYAIVPAESPQPAQWDGRILVPFAPESALSGVGRTVGEENALWYKTSFKAATGGRQLLHFDAVDWQAEVWVNGIKAGEHSGGYTRFTLDVTPCLKGSGKQELVVRVLDGTDNGKQPRGKQVREPEGIWYTAVTGIWQSVWTETVPESYIVRYEAVADVPGSTFTVLPVVEGAQEGDRVEVEADGQVVVTDPDRAAVIKVQDPKLWTPDDPWLYDIQIRLVRDGKTVDAVKGYSALRSISAVGEGRKRMALNGEPLFEFGPLDQGWWPDGLYTAPTDEALVYDIRKTKELGYNMIRKHIKVEPERWYWWCDKLGMLVWQDMPSMDDNSETRWDAYGYNGVDWAVTDEAKATYFKEWGEIIAQLKNHPSIVVWVPFNEAWAQFETEKAVAFTREQDPTRLINQSSGGNFVKGCGDILDVHHYPNAEMPLWEEGMVNVLGEYGGIGYPVEGHLWQPDRNWGYIEHHSGEQVLAQYREYAEQLKELIRQGCAAAVYTQTTDVEIEVNGLMTYDRALVKMDEKQLADINRDVIATLQ